MDNQPLDAELVREIYDELRQMARHQLRRERNQQTLQTTALVHEAYLKLAGRPGVVERDRSYFFAAASRAMRQVLVDAARHRNRGKRGEGKRPQSLVGIDPGNLDNAEETLWVHEALTQFAADYPLQAQVVEGRFFAGLTVQETAQALDVTERTVRRHWSFARAWLHRKWLEG